MNAGALTARRDVRAALGLAGAAALCLVGACSRDTSDAGPRAAAAVAAIALRSGEYQDRVPPLPVDLDYPLPADLPAGVPFALEFEVRTPLERGVLEVEVAGLVGATLEGEPRLRVDLATPPRRFALRLVPAAQARRSLDLTLSTLGNLGRQTRTWHIVLPPSAVR